MPTPLPSKPVKLTRMTFAEALQCVLEGKKINRIEWDNKNDYGFLENNELRLHTSKDNQIHTWAVSRGDMEAHDWITIE